MVATDTSSSTPGQGAIDPVPVVITAQEWEELSAGLVQRARLLDALHADLYGPRTVLAGGVAPVGALLEDPGYLRAAVSIPSRAPQRLFALSTTVTRTAEGTWSVLHDQVDVPGGAGLTLEIRRVLSRSAPALYRSTALRRLHPFYESMRSALTARSRTDGTAGRAVVLVDDQDTSTGFDHHRFANLLGRPAVSATDLTVRDGVLSLQGPHADPDAAAIDTVVRMVPSALVDPLDLGPTPLQGVTGLLEAARRGVVEVLNPVGAGVLESAALRALLPDLCRQLLHEDLRLRGVEESAAPLAELSLAPHRDTSRASADGAPGGSPSGPSDGSASGPLSDPTEDGHLVGRPVAVQLLVVATEDGFEVLPGGIARTTDEGPEATKDVWVLATTEDAATPGAVAPLDASTASAPAEQADVDRQAPPALPVPPQMLTRSVGSDLFWFGRYMERVDSASRLLRTIRDVANDLDPERGPEADAALGVLLRAVADVTGTGATMQEVDPRDREQVRRELGGAATDAHRPGSLAQSFRALERTARSLRDMVADEVWPVLTRMRGSLEELTDPVGVIEEQVLRDLVVGGLGLAGIVSDGMSRTTGRDLVQAGRRIERAMGLLALLRSCFDARRPRRVEGRVSEAAATILDAASAYRRTYDAPLQGELLLELALEDTTLPRSLAFQLDALREAVGRLPETTTESRARSLLTELSGRVAGWRARELLAVDEQSAGAGPTVLVAETTAAMGTLRELSEALEEEYFRVPESTSTWGFDDV
ncbi:hypothetical protein DEO23_05375 [Brachybacterium endophyticum]|uniref:Uncharacterized protein n=2 Tax=Brachybacterium endophyticum TaxID=2182385 RepID=A0A2U2RMA8_9MICO|nr:hypothetical protein DEO23_05375 [Brachybacterium endophyticum]